MELVRGIPITDYCDQNNLPVNERLELFVSVCRAVQHAHQKGIVHRDLKPTNILVTLHDGRPVPKVIDFGVAKAIDRQLTQETLFTRFAEMIGTPLYMSPEQAEMSGLDVDTRTDIYSLGVLLYELLTGSTPFDKQRLREAAYDEIRRIIREEEPQKPSTRLSTLGDHARRGGGSSARRPAPPQPAHARRSGLDRDEGAGKGPHAPVRDGQRPGAGRRARFGRRTGRGLPAVAALPGAEVCAAPSRARGRGVCHFACVLVGTGVSLWQAIRATAAAASERRALLDLGQEQVATRRELAHTQEAKEQATRELFDSLIAQARANRLSQRMGQRYGTFEILGKAITIAGALKLPAERLLEMRNQALAAMALTDMKVGKEWAGNSASPMDFDPGLSHYACGDFEGTVSVRRVGSGAEARRLPAPGPGEVYPQFSPDGCLLAVVHPGLARIQVWRLKDHETSEMLPGEKPAKVLDEGCRRGFGFSPDSREIAVQHPDLSMGVFDLATAKRIQHLAPVEGACRLAFNPRSRQLALVFPGAIQVRDLQTDKVLWEQPISRLVSWIEWHPEGKILALAERTPGGGVISLWDVPADKQVASLEIPQGGGLRFAFNHAGTLLAGAGWAGKLCLWDPLASRPLFCTYGFEPRPFSPDDHSLAVRGDENKLRLLRIATAGEYRTLTANHIAGKGPYACSAISADGRLLAGGGNAVGIGLWDFSSGKLLAFLEGDYNFVLWEPSGALLVMGESGLFRRTVRRDPSSGEVHVGCARKALGTRSPVEHRPKPGRAGLGLRSISRRRRPARGSAGAVDSAWAPCGCAFCRRESEWSMGRDGGVRPSRRCEGLGARTGKLEKDLSEIGLFCRVVFSPDGKCLLTTSGFTRQIRAWRVGSWAEIRFKEPLHGDNPAFSPDGRLLVAETGSGVARLLDPASGKEFAQLDDPSQDRTVEFGFSPDSTKLVCATSDGHCLHIWDLRLMRRQLAQMGLDWDMPPHPDPRQRFPKPQKRSVDGRSNSLARGLTDRSASTLPQSLLRWSDEISQKRRN